ncbi:MAG: CehA/McbA family metallohydrolase [Prosthecobacter sp.]|nr:CehA/McbA family metallohydrolase [Prosthecobacter sp.]
MYKSLAALLLLACAPLLHGAEVIEAGPGREQELPGGKEADGIRGDFVLRNDKVEAVISQNAPNRRANMSTFYGADGVSPGCLYDLTLRGANNDQLVVFGPAGHGAVSFVKVVEGLKGGEAAVESVTTAAKNGGVYKHNEYRVKDGKQGIYITTTLRNETDKAQKVNVKSDMARFNASGTTVEGIYWADAINPAHKCGYALATLNVKGREGKAADVIEIGAGKEVVIERFFAVGRSPAEAVGEALEAKGGKVKAVRGTVRNTDDTPVTTAAVMVPFTDEKPLPAYPDDKGMFAIKVPTEIEAFQVQDLGRETVEGNISGNAFNVRLKPASCIRFDITDAEGSSIPCKAHFEPLDANAPKLDLGPKERAHGCVDQYHSEKGQFTVQLPPGKYRVFVVRGPEYDHIEKEVNLAAEQTVEFKGKLTRVVDTKGWISMDPHNHSTPSGDNVCDTDGRLINLAAEHIEFAPTTEHNRLYDWRPLINKLGLAPFIQTVPGMELTGPRAHFNSFPFTPEPYLQDGGAPVWNDDPRINAFTLRRWQKEDPTRWIQINHPDLTNLFADRDQDGISDGGFVGIGGAIDGFESENGAGTDILLGAPFRVSRAPGSLAAKVSMVREFLWLQLLNQGLRPVVVGVADAHTVYGNGVGCWRNYIPSSTDDPAKISWDELSPKVKKGNLVLSTAPFLEVTTSDGHVAGDDVRGNGGIDLKVRVQCNTWAGIDRVQVLVNGRQEPKLNFTRAANPDMFGKGVVQFDKTIHVPLQTDAHLIVVAVGEHETLKTGFGTSAYAKMLPMAYNNPIYVDVDGNGFTPNGDTLGFEIPAAGVSADQAKALLNRAGAGGQ